jgi:hypothetical protein
MLMLVTNLGMGGGDGEVGGGDSDVWLTLDQHRVRHRLGNKRRRGWLVPGVVHLLALLGL